MGAVKNLAVGVAAFGAYYAQGASEADFIPDEVLNGDDILEYLAVGLP